VPELQRRGAFRDGYPDAGWPATLRGLLGLSRPANRYRPRAAGEPSAAEVPSAAGKPSVA
jgi:hypothetical protein